MEFVTKCLEKWASETGDKPFIYYGEEQKTYTYKQFNEMVNSFAHNLIERGIQKGDDKIAKGYMGVVAPFLEAAIVNEHDEECDVGEPGQIVFRPRFPDIVLKEYFNKPEATVEAFQNLWFHTGDVGYKTEDGIYYFVDRMKDVIRSRGENVSSYQVEDLINQHELVSLSAAFPIPAEEGEEDDIVVYVVPKSNELSEEMLREWAKETMPKFMWPKHIRLINDLPRTPTNKIEKYKLKEQILEELEQKN